MDFTGESDFSFDVDNTLIPGGHSGGDYRRKPETVVSPVVYSKPVYSADSFLTELHADFTGRNHFHHFFLRQAGKIFSFVQGLLDRFTAYLFLSHFTCPIACFTEQIGN